MSGRPDALSLVPSFIKERIVRRNHQALYNSLVFAKENSSLLLKNGAQNLKDVKPRGIPLAVSCFRAVARWINEFETFAESPEVFASQMLEPIRAPADFLNRIREGSPATTTIDTFVFSRSTPHFDRHFGRMVTTLSVIIPDLQVCMSLRHTVDNLASVAYGPNSFSGVQPLPVVNRVHPAVGLRSAKSVRHWSLSELDFLKVDFDDVANVSRTLAYESACIIESFQDKREHLAVPLIVTGRLVSVLPPLITLADASNKSLEFVISDDLAGSYAGGIDGIERAQGKWVRLFGVVWYGQKSGPGATRWPEAFRIEELGCPEGATLDGIVGLIRLRGSVEESEILRRFPSLDLRGLPSSIGRVEGKLQWRASESAGDPIKDEFLRISNQLRQRRFAGHSGTSFLLLPAFSLLDRAKLRVAGLTQIVSGDPELSDCLLRLIRKEDEIGPLGTRRKEVFESTLYSSEDAARLYPFLREIGFIMRKDGKLFVSPVARQVAYSLTRREIKADLEKVLKNGGGVFSIPELEAEGTAYSLIVSGIRELQTEGRVEPASVGGRRFELVWIRKGGLSLDQNMKESRAKINQLVSRVLGALATLNTPMGATRIVELLQGQGHPIGYSSVLEILRQLQSEGRVLREIESQGNVMWDYPCSARVVDTIVSNPDRALTLDEIAGRLRIPGWKKSEILPILKALEKSGKAMEIVPGRWIEPSTPDPQLRFLRFNCHEIVSKAILGGGGFATKARLISELFQFLRESSSKYGKKLGLSWSPKETRDKADEFFDEMISSKYIVQKMGFWTLADETESRS